VAARCLSGRGCGRAERGTAAQLTFRIGDDLVFHAVAPVLQEKSARWHSARGRQAARGWGRASAGS
jgi:hypothetical protein